MKLDKYLLGVLRGPMDVDGDDNGGGDDDVDTGIIDVEDVTDDDEVNLDNPEGGDDKGGNLSPEQLAASVAAALQRSSGGQRQDDTPKLTREQFQKQMGRPEISKDLIAILRNQELDPVEAATALQAVLDQHADYVLRVNGVAADHQFGQLDAKYKPLIEQQRQQQERQFFTSVEKEFPSLKGKQQILALAAQQMRQNGYQSQGVQKDQLALAVFAAKLIKNVDANFVLKRASGGGGRAGVPKMASSVNGAGGNGAARGGQRQTLSPAMALYKK